MTPRRDENGRFVKGSSGNPNGRPSRKREQRFLEITMQACTFEDWKQIVKRAVTDAKGGDGVARKWLSDYLIGPPVQRSEIDATIGGAIVLQWPEENADNTA